jgi:hypothetical protein
MILKLEYKNHTQALDYLFFDLYTKNKTETFPCQAEIKSSAFIVRICEFVLDWIRLINFFLDYSLLFTFLPQMNFKIVFPSSRETFLGFLWEYISLFETGDI